MTKAILILDNIDETEIAELRANVQLNLYGEDRGEYKNCLLKPMPEKKNTNDIGDITDDLVKQITIYRERKGWNDCLDELLGEEK